ncbi:pyrroline-5-carboxylate reductase [Roseivirga pacifica]|uniref:Pyrroline-5-carboxylate reductase n=1 Tax=Roseivirga pacifica TaxID=1267423 RepID=A0A1I0QBZ6_9BACT|nr:pyrroline-5-carboxylate reductase [Roseivirga pacifica]MCO6360685.1 pyrroline-5-carboxylate reductase [Roseivirga pacifica]MCO6368574.1 pyrroline-5-carboxylate reductase [Roseivirga pacifica]MCO6372716.1 pyrroline-5-carboxylate reductase [Roseivirga pacifica]MCO6376774.1 pyrroline-5-carboxylate reductase [Roseivirga pacifica]MCO6377946.1 pyrroline-5-carboxylate reductase [Roseivirga pacifica]
MKVLVIGAGNMGLTYGASIGQSGYLDKEDLMIYDKSTEVVEKLREKNNPNYEVYDDLEECLPISDIIFIAVKPYHNDALMEEMKPMMNDQQLAISIMAGVTIETIQAGLGIQKVVRAMPNLPAQVGKGMTSYLAAPEISRIELWMVEDLLNSTGKSVRVDSEKFIDASTGISGSGPAYVFYFMESMMEAARNMGFSDNDSKVLVSQTFEGAIELFNKNKLSPKGWMKRVASKGGTTQAALDSFDDNNVHNLIREAAYAAFNRAIELGKPEEEVELEK